MRSHKSILYIIKITVLAAVVFSILSGFASAEDNLPKEAVLFQQKKMTGDFNKMVQRRKIRALVSIAKRSISSIEADSMVYPTRLFGNLKIT